MPLALLKPAPIPKLSKLIGAARLYPCVLCWKVGFTVPAHCNDVTVKGIGKKAPHFLVAYLCGDPGGCHGQVDGRAGALTKDEKRALWAEAYWKTVKLWFEERMVLIA